MDPRVVFKTVTETLMRQSVRKCLSEAIPGGRTCGLAFEDLRNSETRKRNEEDEEAGLFPEDEKEELLQHVLTQGCFVEQDPDCCLHAFRLLRGPWEGPVSSPSTIIEESEKQQSLDPEVSVFVSTSKTPLAVDFLHRVASIYATRCREALDKRGTRSNTVHSLPRSPLGLPFFHPLSSFPATPQDDEETVDATQWGVRVDEEFRGLDLPLLPSQVHESLGELKTEKEEDDQQTITDDRDDCCPDSSCKYLAEVMYQQSISFLQQFPPLYDICFRLKPDKKTKDEHLPPSVLQQIAQSTELLQLSCSHLKDSSSCLEAGDRILTSIQHDGVDLKDLRSMLDFFQTGCFDSDPKSHNDSGFWSQFKSPFREWDDIERLSHRGFRSEETPKDQNEAGKCCKRLTDVFADLENPDPFSRQLFPASLVTPLTVNEILTDKQIDLIKKRRNEAINRGCHVLNDALCCQEQAFDFLERSDYDQALRMFSKGCQMGSGLSCFLVSKIIPLSRLNDSELLSFVSLILDPSQDRVISSPYDPLVTRFLLERACVLGHFPSCDDLSNL